MDSNLNSSEKVLTKSSKVNGEKSSAAVVENNDLNGVVESVSDAPSEVQLAESEQATYASSNNDLKGTKAYQEADVPGLYNLAMAIIDYRGHRVVAQVCTLFLFLVNLCGRGLRCFFASFLVASFLNNFFVLLSFPTECSTGNFTR